MTKSRYKGTALDLVQTSSMKNHIPIIYCYMVLDSVIDIDRLNLAVKRIAKIVPEILCRYNCETNTWIPINNACDSIVKIISDSSSYVELIWDLCTNPQLKINVYHHHIGDSLQIGISHILTDGAGFTQFLGLLCALYNDPDYQTIDKKNSRSMTPLLFYSRFKKIKSISKRAEKDITSSILRAEQELTFFSSLKITLTEKQFKAVQEKARNLKVTLNDVFMASYAQALKVIFLQTELILPCPADLRKFIFQNNKLTIANMTGKYLCPVSLLKTDGIKDTVLAIHNEMERQKSHTSCFQSIPYLQLLYTLLPVNLVRQIIKKSYSLDPISYTNIGAIDEKAIYFHGITIKECFLCGTYRQAPSFQVSISTYKNNCTFAVNMSGSEKQKMTAMQILSQMKSFLLYEL